MTALTYAQVYDFDNLLLAWYRAARGKRGRDAVALFEYRLEDRLIGLQAALREQTYLPGPYTSFFIHEPKRRLISAAPFPDRVVHHAVCNLLEQDGRSQLRCDDTLDRDTPSDVQVLR